MNHEFLSKNKFSPNWRFNKLFQSKREVLLPVSADTALELFRSAFVSPLVISKGPFLPELICHGHVYANHIYIKYTVNTGRYQSHWKIDGHLSDGTRGSKLTITIVEQTPAWVYFSMVCIGLLIWIDGNPLWTAFPALLFCLVVVATSWGNRIHMEESICAVLLEIILSGKPKLKTSSRAPSYTSKNP